MPAYARVSASGMQVMNNFHGIKYTEVGRPVGMPLGGVGAGCLEISSQGELMEFANVNNWSNRIPSIPGSALWLTYKSGNTRKVFPLSGGRVNFEGNFPFAKLTFPDLPVKLTLWCWSPFIFHNTHDSAYPAAIFDAEVKNTGTKNAEIGLVLSYGTDYGGWLQRFTLPDSDAPVSVASKSESYRGKSTSGISFSTRAVLSGQYPTREQAIMKDIEAAYLRSYDYEILDITSACNRSYLRCPLGSHADQSDNFAGLPHGSVDIYGIPFTIKNDAENARRSCILVGPEAGKFSVSIPVDRKADCLFVLGNCADCPSDGSAKYVVKYEDGSKQVVPVRNGFELSNWLGNRSRAIYCPGRLTGKTERGETYTVNVFAIKTNGNKKIRAIELSKSGQVSPMVFAVTVGRLSKTPLANDLMVSRHKDLEKIAMQLAALTSTDGNYTLAARKAPNSTVLTYQVSKPDVLAKALAAGKPVHDLGSTVYAVEQKACLKGGQSTVLGLVCSWYTPNLYMFSGEKQPGIKGLISWYKPDPVDPTLNRVGHQYEKWFVSSAAVAEKIAKDHNRLLQRTKKHYDVIATSTLPKWYREMLQSNFYLQPAITLWTKDGTTFAYETPWQCPVYGTMDVSYYGSFSQLAAFPDLYARTLSGYATVQTGEGMLPHNLGVTNGLVNLYRRRETGPITLPDNKAHVYDDYRADIPIKFCLEVARQYQWTGDEAILNSLWPNVKRAMTFIRALDEDDDGLPETSFGYDSWRMVGRTNYMANQWIAALSAVAQLADCVGEHDYASSLRALKKRAATRVQEVLWTGNYFRQSDTNRENNQDMVGIMQTPGDWYGDILGFSTGLPDSLVTSALETINRVLVKNARYGATVCLYPDGRSNDAWQCYIEDTGWAYTYASMCMYRGMDDIGLDVANKVWSEFTVREARLPWCQENVIEDPHSGVCPYWLTRNMRMGVTIVLSYAAGGIKMDMHSQTASVVPANWVWKSESFTLPVVMPQWLGQVRCQHHPGAETYTISSLDQSLRFKCLTLRTDCQGTVNVSINGRIQRCLVSPHGTIAINDVNIPAGTIVIRITKN